MGSDGRSVLAGALIGAVASLFGLLGNALEALLAGMPPRPVLGSWDALRGQRAALAELGWVVSTSTLVSLLGVFLLVGTLFLVRRKLPAVALSGAVLMFIGLTVDGVPWTGSGPASMIGLTVTTGLLMVALLRFGLVALIVAVIFMLLALIFPTSDWTAWHAQPSIFALVAAAALAGYGYRAATMGGRRTVRSLGR